MTWDTGCTCGLGRSDPLASLIYCTCPQQVLFIPVIQDYSWHPKGAAAISVYLQFPLPDTLPTRFF